ncbi:MAG TPA: hydroxyectoine utilization dehydratase EutB [Trueperaceae bacterium]
MSGPAAHGLSLIDVYRARSRIRGLTVRTPLVPSAALSRRAGSPVHLKLENQQYTGSFKLRGALNALLALSPEERERGVVTVSTGNHGRAVAHACRMTGSRATVCMSRLVPANKVAAIEELEARIVICGDGQDDAQLEAERLRAEEGLTFIPPFDHPEVIAGQATAGLEIAEQLVEARQGRGATDQPLQILVPLSGGGLISGVALAIKSLDPNSRVVGVSMERGCAMYQCQQAGGYRPVEEQESLADSLGGGIGADNRYTFAMVRELVDEIQLVGEEQIAAAIVHAYLEERQVVEGAAAVGIAALLRGPTAGSDRETVVLVSGANIDMELHRRLVARASTPERELAAEGGD